ncbi:elongation factor P [Terriglobus sp.]|uniref:elongation factor P n=1 Tax=Terriglobus sp. TaxID=1889013 RepID=UPI003AFFCF1C
MAALLEALEIKRKTVFEFEDAPYVCMDSDVSTPTARGGQTLVRLKMRNLVTGAVFDKTFKANDKFKEPDVSLVPASFLYSDGEGFHFMDQESYETLTLAGDKVGDAVDFLTEGLMLQMHTYNGNPIALQLPLFVELEVTETEPAARGDFSSGSGTKSAKVETGMTVRVPPFVKQGERIKISTDSREFAGRV